MSILDKLEQLCLTRIEICGCGYLIKKTRPALDDNLNDCCGYVDKPNRRIVINNTLPFDEQKSTLRHELLHAFFHECGLEKYCNDELLIDFLEIQLPKLFALCNELKVI